LCNPFADTHAVGFFVQIDSAGRLGHLSFTELRQLVTGLQDRLL
jgi:hypothetical protein